MAYIIRKQQQAQPININLYHPGYNYYQESLTEIVKNMTSEGQML